MGHVADSWRMMRQSVVRSNVRFYSCNHLSQASLKLICPWLKFDLLKASALGASVRGEVVC